MIYLYSYNLQNKCTKSLLYVSFIPYFRLLVFGIFRHLSCMIFFPFFPSHPSCLTKCKQELGNNFVFSPSDHKPKTKDGMKFTLVNILTLIWWTVISYIFLKMERKWKCILIFSHLYSVKWLKCMYYQIIMLEICFPNSSQISPICQS